MSIMNTPQVDGETQYASKHSDHVGASVASQTLRAQSLALAFHDGMAVVDYAVKQVEYVPADHGGEGHAAPVSAEAVDAEGFGDQGGKAAKQEAVGDAGEAGH